MNPHPVFTALAQRLSTEPMTRLLFFGSSNTERRIPGMHWIDVVDIAFKRRYGRIHHCLNAGRGGDSSGQLLERFEDEAAIYRPHLVVLTVGGNDFVRNLPVEEYRSNLFELHRRFAELEAPVIFQTYYSPDPERAKAVERLRDLERFYEMMEVFRTVARETGSALVDQLRRWELLRTHHPEAYEPLMVDAMHVNEAGNLLMGAELARAFGVEAELKDPGYWETTRRLQQQMDAAEPA